MDKNQNLEKPIFLNCRTFWPFPRTNCVIMVISGPSIVTENLQESHKEREILISDVMVLTINCNWKQNIKEKNKKNSWKSWSLCDVRTGGTGLANSIITINWAHLNQSRVCIEVVGPRRSLDLELCIVYISNQWIHSECCDVHHGIGTANTEF